MLHFATAQSGALEGWWGEEGTVSVVECLVQRCDRGRCLTVRNLLSSFCKKTVSYSTCLSDEVKKERKCRERGMGAGYRESLESRAAAAAAAAGMAGNIRGS